DLRKLKPPDPKKVRLATMVLAEIDPKDPRKQLTLPPKEVPVNPFTRAFVSCNPTMPVERPKDADKLDRAVLEKLNRYESLSLLKCPKAVTLVVKQFNTPLVVQTKSSGSSFLDAVGTTLGLKGKDDYAATDAHNLAEALRKLQFEAYVLHTQFASFVTIGAFDSMED